MAYHQYPNNKNYGGYHGDDGPIWPAFAIIIGGIGLLFLFVKYSAPLGEWLKQYDAGTVIACLVIGGFTALTMGTVAWFIITAILNWWDGLFFGCGNVPHEPYKPGSTVKNTNNTTYMAPKPKTPAYSYNAGVRATLLPSEREKPPRAEFFGRLQGIPLHAKGLYEEKWLNIHEYNYWMTQKARKDAKEAGLLDKKVVKDLLDINTTTKIDF